MSNIDDLMKNLSQSDKAFFEEVQKAVKPQSLTDEQWTNFCSNLAITSRRLQDLTSDLDWFTEHQMWYDADLNYGPANLYNQSMNAMKDFEAFIVFTKKEKPELRDLVMFHIPRYERCKKSLQAFMCYQFMSGTMELRNEQTTDDN